MVNKGHRPQMTQMALIQVSERLSLTRLNAFQALEVNA